MIGFDSRLNLHYIRPMDIHIGIVAYRPDTKALLALIALLGDHPIWLFLNSPLDSETFNRLPVNARVLSLGGENVGLGAAYNHIITEAKAAGAKKLLLLDQDSEPPTDMAIRLSGTFDLLVAWQEQPAVVGPLPIAVADDQHKPPREFHARHVARYDSVWCAEFVISSGSLIDLTVCQSIGGFREDFFIDAIDIEWCFRAQSQGYTCWIDEAVCMPHRLGEGVIRVPGVGWRLAKQSPGRLYTYVRNQIAMLRLPHVPRSWRLRIVPYILVQGAIYLIVTHGSRWRVARALMAGWSDGARTRLGPGRRNDF
jgi:rhamnosyltransferase